MNRQSMNKVRAVSVGVALAGMAIAAPASAQGSASPAPAPAAAKPASAPAAASPSSAPAAASPAATPEEKSKSDRADALLRQGNGFAKKDQWTEAEPLFQEAFQLKRSYDIAGNLGLAELALKKFPRAAAHLRFALDSFPANGKPEHRKLLESMFAKARAEVAVLAVHADVTGATILVDGEEAGIAPQLGEVFVDPGEHTIEAKLAGHADARQVVEVIKSSVAVDVRLHLPEMLAEGAALPQDKPPPAHAQRLRLVPLIVGGGLSVVALGTGIGLTVAANGKSSDAEALRSQAGTSWACRAPAPELRGQCGALSDALGAKDTLSDGAVVAFVTGGVILAGTAAFAVWDLMGVRKSATVGIVPVVGQHARGLMVAGSW